MKKSEEEGEVVMDGSNIKRLVENKRVFSNFVDHKFQKLDRDCDGKLFVKELQPAVADILCCSWSVCFGHFTCF